MATYGVKIVVFLVLVAVCDKIVPNLTCNGRCYHVRDIFNILNLACIHIYWRQVLLHLTCTHRYGENVVLHFVFTNIYWKQNCTESYLYW